MLRAVIVMLWPRGLSGALYGVPGEVGVLPGFVLIGASVLTGAQVAVAHEIVAAINAEAEETLRAA
jgi:hypothetical protein